MSKPKYIDINNVPPITGVQIQDIRTRLEMSPWKAWGVWAKSTPRSFAQMIARIDRLELLLSQARNKADSALKRARAAEQTLNDIYAHGVRR